MSIKLHEQGEKGKQFEIPSGLFEIPSTDLVIPETMFSRGQKGLLVEGRDTGSLDTAKYICGVNGSLIELQ